MTLRALTWIVSLALHGGLTWYFLADFNGQAYAQGSGNDQFIVEQGIAIEGAAVLGNDEVTVQAVEAEPIELSEARPEVEEVKPDDLLDKTEIITSPEGPEQETKVEEVKEPEPREKQVATIEQMTETPIEEKLSAGEQQTGGDSSLLKAYEGQMHSHLMKRAVRPRGTERAGKVVVRFTTSPTGEVISREVAESSGLSSVDEAALASIDKASPFPPAPAGLASGPMVHTVPFKYTVR